MSATYDQSWLARRAFAVARQGRTSPLTARTARAWLERLERRCRDTGNAPLARAARRARGLILP